MVAVVMLQIPAADEAGLTCISTIAWNLRVESVGCIMFAYPHVYAAVHFHL
jgi:hypothetical protein